MGRIASPHSGMSGAEMGSGHAGSSIRIDNQKHDQSLGQLQLQEWEAVICPGFGGQTGRFD